MKSKRYLLPDQNPIQIQKDIKDLQRRLNIPDSEISYAQQILGENIGLQRLYLQKLLNVCVFNEELENLQFQVKDRLAVIKQAQIPIMDKQQLFALISEIRSILIQIITKQVDLNKSLGYTQCQTLRTLFNTQILSFNQIVQLYLQAKVFANMEHTEVTDRLQPLKNLNEKMSLNFLFNTENQEIAFIHRMFKFEPSRLDYKQILIFYKKETEEYNEYIKTAQICKEEQLNLCIVPPLDVYFGQQTYEMQRQPKIPQRYATPKIEFKSRPTTAVPFKSTSTPVMEIRGSASFCRKHIVLQSKSPKLFEENVLFKEEKIVVPKRSCSIRTAYPSDYEFNSKIVDRATSPGIVHLQKDVPPTYQQVLTQILRDIRTRKTDFNVEELKLTQRNNSLTEFKFDKDFKLQLEQIFKITIVNTTDFLKEARYQLQLMSVYDYSYEDHVKILEIKFKTEICNHQSLLNFITAKYTANRISPQTINQLNSVPLQLSNITNDKCKREAEFELQLQNIFNVQIKNALMFLNNFTDYYCKYDLELGTVLNFVKDSTSIQFRDQNQLFQFVQSKSAFINKIINDENEPPKNQNNGLTEAVRNFTKRFAESLGTEKEFSLEQIVNALKKSR
ncbi:Conserved_hypothetical protein [Hexamita inflata]|uniref:Uncharacterized protein n=2 Tax=Hexamita inflata TaxID=28002 RepID=A0AA86RGB5_9EUKA|nr:Conserved hypothetical protein [Hexamita inflata]